jgi:hypothetical protein
VLIILIVLNTMSDMMFTIKVLQIKKENIWSKIFL